MPVRSLLLECVQVFSLVLLIYVETISLVRFSCFDTNLCLECPQTFYLWPPSSKLEQRNGIDSTCQILSARAFCWRRKLINPGALEEGHYTCWHFEVFVLATLDTSLTQYSGPFHSFPIDRDGCDGFDACGTVSWPCKVLRGRRGAVRLRWRMPWENLALPLFSSVVLGVLVVMLFRAQRQEDAVEHGPARSDKPSRLTPATSPRPSRIRTSQPLKVSSPCAQIGTPEQLSRLSADSPSTAVVFGGQGRGFAECAETRRGLVSLSPFVQPTERVCDLLRFLQPSRTRRARPESPAIS